MLKFRPAFFLVLAVLSVLGMWGCGKKPVTLFEILSPDKTGIYFKNDIHENDSFNVLNFEYIYNGGGVGIGDFNNDGLQDVFFSGNLVSNELYLNKGGFRFVNVSEAAGIEARNSWCTGVAVVDINTDGLEDIYVCVVKFDKKDDTHNLLFVNQGTDKDGIPRFKEMSQTFCLDDVGSDMSAAFFDYDNDGDLDLYILTNMLETIAPNKLEVKKKPPSPLHMDKLYRNEGNGTFAEVTAAAGIKYEGYGLGISIRDYNHDGRKDIYITNDYLSNDVMYINNGDGTFSNKIKDYIKHQTHSAMGHDAADINNDGWVDIFTLDMLPKAHEQQKRMLTEAKYNKYLFNERNGYGYQYLRNMLQLNNGADIYGNHNFSEIGIYADVYATEWSWSALLADLDYDGYKDLFVSNGYPRDLIDMDFITTMLHHASYFSREEVLSAIPVIKVPNVIFRNNGNLTFKDVSAEWGSVIPSFSNGSAYVDLDNDGDLDFVVSNFNAEAFIYRNTVVDDKETAPGYLKIGFQGSPENPAGEGAQVSIHYGKGKKQYREHSRYHGFMSSMDPHIFFGLDSISVVDSLIVTWPDGNSQLIRGIEADTEIILNYRDSKPSKESLIYQVLFRPPQSGPFRPASGETGLKFLHTETDYIDFNIQELIPHKFSQFGPALAVADVNGDGFSDVFIGGSYFKSGTLCLQKDGKFVLRPLENADKKEKEDLGALFFDVDGDGDQDLYVVSGGYEGPLTAEHFADRLYLNDGYGNFRQTKSALPEDMLVSGSCVKAADFDRDGDLDLFVGGLVEPGAYPKPVSSFLLRNDSDNDHVRFVDVTEKWCPGLRNIGLVKDALWTDFDNDQKMDLIIAGEWMPLIFFRNKGNVFENITDRSGVGDKTGWWNSITGADFDKDGDIDYIAGNLGLNAIYKASEDEPVTAYASDFDNSGTYDVVLSVFEPDSNGIRHAYPVHARDDLIRQMPFMKDRFPKFSDYAEVTMNQLFTEEELRKAMKLEAVWFASSYIENLGDGKFRMTALPKPAQMAPVNGVLAADIDDDGMVDAVLVGNDFGNDVFWGRLDALNGLWLKGNGKGGFNPVGYRDSGFFVPADAKSIVELTGKGNVRYVLAGQNRDSLKVFSLPVIKNIRIKANDAWCVIEYTDGSFAKEEFYYGNSFLSQSDRILYITQSVKTVSITSFTGKIRMVKPE